MSVLVSSLYLKCLAQWLRLRRHTSRIYGMNEWCLSVSPQRILHIVDAQCMCSLMGWLNDVIPSLKAFWGQFNPQECLTCLVEKGLMKLISYPESLSKVGSTLTRIQSFWVPTWDCLNHSTVFLQSKLGGRFAHYKNSEEVIVNYQNLNYHLMKKMVVNSQVHTTAQRRLTQSCTNSSSGILLQVNRWEWFCN